MAIKALSDKLIVYDPETGETSYLIAGRGGTFDMYGSDGVLKASFGWIPHRQYRDINLGGVALTKAASNQPDLIPLDTTGILVYGFDGGGKTEELHGSFELQHDYIEETDLLPHLHWYSTTPNSGAVKWSLEYWIIEGLHPDQLIQKGTLHEVTEAPGASWGQRIASFGLIPGADLKIAAQIHFRIYRDSSDPEDTYPDDVALGTAGQHYLTNSRGSADIFSK